MKFTKKIAAAALSAVLAVSANAAVVSSVANAATTSTSASASVILPGKINFTNSTWKKSGTNLVSNSKSTSVLSVSFATGNPYKVNRGYTLSYDITVPAALSKAAGNNINKIVTLPTGSKVTKTGNTYKITTCVVSNAAKASHKITFKNNYQSKYSITVSQIKIVYKPVGFVIAY